MSSESGSKGFADLFAEYESSATSEPTRKPRVGEELTGTVVAISAEAVFVDVGAKAEGVIERAELLDADGQLTVAVGDSVTARVADLRNDNITLRKRMGRGDQAGGELAQAFEHGIPVLGKITGVNKGGVEVETGGVRAFCPASQLELGFVEDMTTYVGRELEFRVTKFQAAGRGGKPDVVLSRRSLLEEERAKRATEIMAGLEIGSVLSGRVTTLKEYGAFVDVGGIEGMLHKSELGFGRIGHPKEVLEVGETVQVRVIQIEKSDDPKKRDRISLSLKAMKDDPWDAIVASLAEGSVVTGKVARLEAFGAFIELAAGVEGLVHVSEIADRRINHPREALTVGASVEATVLGVDDERRRLSLSIKGVAAQREGKQAADYKPVAGASLGTFADLMKKKLGKG
jgi:small subunit ribosomal protein S1